MRTTFCTIRAVFRCALIAAFVLFPAAAPELWAATISDTNPRDAFGPLAPSVDHSTFSGPSSASNNAFTVSDPVHGSVYGGIAVGDGVASVENKVNITGTDAVVRIGSSSITGSGVIVGGWSRNGPVTGNTVTISSTVSGAQVDRIGVQVDGIVYGGQVNENIGQNLGSEASYNHVILSGSSVDARTTMRNNIYGAYSGGISYITGNTVEIGKFVTVRLAGGIIAGGYDSVYGANDMRASGNTVTIETDALVEGTAGNHISIYGGRMHTGHASANRVDVTGGTINYADIYGGQNNNISDGIISANTVAVQGGTLNDVTIYGGYAGRGGNAASNNVDIDGATTTFTGTVDVYGGRSGRGMAINNTITIKADATGNVEIDNLYGGYVASGGNNAFSGNKLVKKSDAATIGTVRNVEFVNFGYSADGDANIGVLDSTATGVVGNAAAGVVINTGNDGDAATTTDASRTITFGGRIEGSGSLTKTGDGSPTDILILTNNDNRIINAAGVTVQEGRLEIGNGAAGDGLSGNLVTPKYTVGTATTTGVAATLAYNRDDTVTYGGLISGTDKGILEQAGTGTLILTGDNSAVGAVHVKSGALQLGDGGASGYIAADTYTLENGAALIINRDNAVTVHGRITGDGRLVQRGAGTLTLTHSDDFTGGTAIERGTLDIGAADAYGIANNILTSKGHITFSGPATGKTITLSAAQTETSPDYEGSVIALSNSIRTEGNAGSDNRVNLISPTADWTILGKVQTPDGAFFVAQDTGMDVTARRLELITNMNDLHVQTGGTFTLHTGIRSDFMSGISGTGALRLMPAGPNADATVTFWNLNDTVAAENFSMGATRVEGTGSGGSLFFSLNRKDTTTYERVTFENAQSFTASGAGSPYAGIALGGDGIIRAPDISVTAGAALMPFGGYNSASGDTLVGTLTLDASSGAQNVVLRDFALVYQVGGAQHALDASGDIPLTGQFSNNGLLNIKTDTSKVVDMQGGEVFLAPVGLFGRNGSSDFDTSQDYLIVRTNNGFNGTYTNGAAVPKDMLQASLYGTVIRTGGASGPRGGAEGLRFGDEPDSNGNWTTDTNKNIWFSHSLNSLTMDWVGGARDAWLLRSDSAGALDMFSSLQADASSAHEGQFLGGDKVHISGNGSHEIALDAFRGPQDKIMVSGLVVGKDAHGADRGDGSYTLSGQGGITANAASAFGDYLNPGRDDTLVPTGKLEKFGAGTLTFTNTGVNTFLDGIDLHGGTTRFTRAEQLIENGKGIHLGYEGDPDDPTAPPSTTPSVPGGTTATLEALNDVTLAADIGIAGAFTGTLGAAANTQFTHTGQMRGDASAILGKAGAGVVTLAADSPDFLGNVQVTAGTLHVAAHYGSTAGFSVLNSATLSGAGTLGGNGVIEAGGLLKPGGLEWSGAAAPAEHPLTISASAGGDGNLDFHAGSGFAVRLAEYYGNGDTRYSDRVNVADAVAINPAATLAVEVDYFKLNLSDSAYYTIINAASPPGETTTFAFNANDYLPRGVTLEHGWGLDGQMNQYQIGGIRRTGPGYGDIPGVSHNEDEVGKVIDWLVDTQDPGTADMVRRLMTGDDGQIRKSLDQLSGDLAANALYLGFKEPWRHPFNRLDNELGLDGNEDDTPKPRVWAEASTRYGQLDHDGNARGFTMYRNGVAFGADIRFSRRAIVGAAFRYTRARLEQSNGDVNADDFEAGLYALGGLPGGLFLKGYLGISQQQYEMNREVSLPGTRTGLYGPLYNNMSGETNGHALATSFELTRPVSLFENFRILPLAALDYERVWMNGFTEYTGQTALRYEDAMWDRLMFRFGLKAEFNWQDRLDLKGWAQYATRSGGRDFPAVDARFAAATGPGQPAMDIRGSRMGREYVNLGFSADWKFGEAKNTSLYIKYDAKLYHRMREHAGEFGFMLTW